MEGIWPNGDRHLVPREPLAGTKGILQDTGKMESDPVVTAPFALNPPEEVCRMIEEAFHYRGDVTVHVQSGERIEGYIFNRIPDAESPYLQMYIHGHNAPRHILYSEIVAVSLTGEDTASGGDWEAWIKKKESERQTESARLEAAARARGHL